MEENENKTEIKNDKEFMRLINDTEITITNKRFLDNKIKKNIEYVIKKIRERSLQKLNH